MGELRQRGSAREVRGRKIAQDGAVFQRGWPLPQHPGNKEKCQEGESNTECCQGQTVETGPVGIGVTFILRAVSRGRADRVRVRKVRERMRRLQNRH